MPEWKKSDQGGIETSADGLTSEPHGWKGKEIRPRWDWNLLDIKDKLGSIIPKEIRPRWDWNFLRMVDAIGISTERNQTKVGLKLMGGVDEFDVRIRKKSDQGGIETLD